MQGPPLPPGVDPNYVIHQVTPLIAIAAIAVVGVMVVRVLSQTAIGEAIADRIRQRTRRHGGGAEEDSQRVAALEQQVKQLQDQVSELAERLDFAERVLAERRERKLGAGQ